MKKVLLTILISVTIIGIFSPIEVLASHSHLLDPTSYRPSDFNSGNLDQLIKRGEIAREILDRGAPGGDLSGSLTNSHIRELQGYIDQGEIAQQRLDSPPGGVVGWIADGFQFLIDSLIKLIGTFLILITGALLGLAGTILNWSIELTTVGFSQLFYDHIGGGVISAWKMVRDVVNVGFIFIFLFIGISTILRIEQYGYKQLLARLIIAALLVNFSLFFTQVIIDTSNILAINIYESAVPKHNCSPFGGAIGVSGVESECLGISNKFMDELGVSTFFNKDNLLEIFDADIGGQEGEILGMIFLISIFIIMAAITFFAGAILLIGRTVMLVFLMVVSPIAFGAMILPVTQQYAKLWWKSLFSNALVAPVYLFFLLVSLRIAEGLPKANVGPDGASAPLIGLLTGSTSGLEIIFYFVLIIGFLWASLIIAQKFGSYGSNFALKFATNARRGVQRFVGAAPRGVIGGIASGLEGASRRHLETMPYIGGLSRQLISRPLEALSKQGFGTGKGYRQARDEKIEDLISRAPDTDRPEERAAYAERLKGFKGLRKRDAEKPILSALTASEASRKAAKKLEKPDRTQEIRDRYEQNEKDLGGLRSKINPQNASQLEKINETLQEIRSGDVKYSRMSREAIDEMIDEQEKTRATLERGFRQKLQKEIAGKDAAIKKEESKFLPNETKLANHIFAKEQYKDQISKLDSHQQRKESLEAEMRQEGRISDFRSSISKATKKTAPEIEPQKLKEKEK